MIIIGPLTTQEQKDNVLQYFIDNSYQIRTQQGEWNGIRLDDSGKKITLGSFERYIAYRSSNSAYKSDITMSYEQFYNKLNPSHSSSQKECIENTILRKALNQCDCSKIEVNNNVTINRSSLISTFNNFPEYRAFLLSLFPDALSELVINTGDKIVFNEDNSTYLMCSGSNGKFFVSCGNGLVGLIFGEMIVTVNDIENTYGTKEFKVIKKNG